VDARDDAVEPAVAVEVTESLRDRTSKSRLCVIVFAAEAKATPF